MSEDRLFRELNRKMGTVLWVLFRNPTVVNTLREHDPKLLAATLAVLAHELPAPSIDEYVAGASVARASKDEIDVAREKYAAGTLVLKGEVSYVEPAAMTAAQVLKLALCLESPTLLRTVSRLHLVSTVDSLLSFSEDIRALASRTELKAHVTAHTWSLLASAREADGDLMRMIKTVIAIARVLVVASMPVDDSAPKEAA